MPVSDELGRLIANVARREFGEDVGRKAAGPLGDVITKLFGEEVVTILTGGDDNPLAALGVDGAWMIVAHTMNPRRISARDGESIEISDAAWRGFVLGLQKEMKRRAPMADGKDDKDDKDEKKKKDPPPPPAPPKNPLNEALTGLALSFITDEGRINDAAQGINHRADRTRRVARGVQGVDRRSKNRRTGLGAWCATLWNDIMAALGL